MLRATSESPRLFRSDWLDVWTRVPWWGVPVVYVPLISWMFAEGWGLVGPAAIGWAAAGLFVWTLTEYLLHRFFFHWIPPFSWGPRMHFLIHGIHHEWVNDRYRLVMPPAVSLLLAAPLFAGWWALLGVPAVPFFGGLLVGYLGYDMLHYAMHHARLRAGWFKRLQAHHLSHHGRATRKFGVSSPVWDRVFGTY